MESGNIDTSKNVPATKTDTVSICKCSFPRGGADCISQKLILLCQFTKEFTILMLLFKQIEEMHISADASFLPAKEQRCTDSFCQGLCVFFDLMQRME